MGLVRNGTNLHAPYTKLMPCCVFCQTLILKESYSLTDPKSFHDILKCRNAFSYRSQQSASITAALSPIVPVKLLRSCGKYHWLTPYDFTAEPVLLVSLLFESGRKEDSVKNVWRQFRWSVGHLRRIKLLMRDDDDCTFKAFFAVSPVSEFDKLLHAQSSVRPFPVLTLACPSNLFQ